MEKDRNSGSCTSFVSEIDRRSVERKKKLSTYFAAVRETNNKRHGRSKVDGLEWDGQTEDKDR